MRKHGPPLAAFDAAHQAQQLTLPGFWTSAHLQDRMLWIRGGRRFCYRVNSFVEVSAGTRLVVLQSLERAWQGDNLKSRPRAMGFEYALVYVPHSLQVK